MEQENLLHLIIIDKSMDDADLLVSTLRDAGHDIRSVFVRDESEFHSALEDQNPDLILCDVNMGAPDLEQVQQAVIQSKQDIPIIATASALSSKQQLKAIQAGALDLVCKKNSEHFQFVIDREIKNLAARRKLATYDASHNKVEKKLQSLVDSSRNAIAYINEGMHIYANPIYREMFGFPGPEEIESTPVMDIISPDNHSKLKNYLRRYSNGEQGTMELEIQALRPEGITFDATIEFSPASIEGEPCTQLLIRDQSISKELEKKVKYLSKQDLLTGLYSRQYFLKILNIAVLDARDNKNTYSILYIVPDRFSNVKATVGIAGADLVIGDIASIIRDNHEGSDIAARFGDCSFTVMTKMSDIAIVTALADKIRASIEDHISEIAGTSISVTCSIGITMFDETANEAQEVISNADLACELAQKDGGNRVHVHNPIADKLATQEREKESIALIRGSLVNNRYTLVYQPIASLHGDKVEKYEVLVRMLGKEDNEILPDQFIPIAEETGLIVDIDRWIIAKAMKTLAERRNSGSNTVFFIKLSGISIADNDLLPWIIKQLKKNRLEGNSVVFELSESAVVNQLKKAQAFLKGLTELHCGFGLEHFGVGANSVQLLKHLPANYLKIDGSFMHKLASNRENQEIIRSITNMAISRHMTTIAEFVEDASSLAILWQCGINFIQGYFLQEPDKIMNYDFSGEEQIEA
ncbi:MAG: EAL domain-containing protein [Gammaproteobacteria bacterium]|nr:EAL domain-containing protein [Gammaproteobacteria bacterium]